MGTTDSGSIESLMGSIIEPEESIIEEEEVSEDQTETDEIDDVEDEFEDEFEDDTDDEFEDEDADDTGEDDDDSVDDAGHEEPELITVKVDGVEAQVTLDDLKQGYSGQKYVQKGMAEAAQLKKQNEAFQQTLQAEQQKIAKIYQKLQSGGFRQPPKAPDIALLDDDPIGYMEQKARYEAAQQKYDGDMSDMQKVTQQQQAQQEQERQAFIQRESETLKEKMPELADAKKAKAIWTKMVDSGQANYGFSSEEVSGIVDHRAMMVLHDAMKYREMMANKSKVQKKTKSARPVIKPGAKKVNTGKSKAAQRRQARLKNSGSIDDALGMILET